MSTLKSIIFETLPDPEEYWETAEALKDLDRQYQHFTRTVWKASKQLLKFDEINRLVAYEVEEKAPKVTTGRSSSGRSSSSSKSSTTSKPSAKSTSSHSSVPDPFANDFAVEFKLKDILFDFFDIDWEQVMRVLIAGLTTVSGGLIGGTIALVQLTCKIAAVQGVLLEDNAIVEKVFSVTSKLGLGINGLTIALIIGIVIGLLGVVFQFANTARRRA